MTDYTQQKIDWTLYLERKQPVYLFASIIPTYGALLEEVTGFIFKHQLHTFHKDIGVFYRSISEMKAADEYYLTLVKNNDSRFKEWNSISLENNKLADALIAEFRDKGDLTDVRERAAELQKHFEDILLYGTIIPYRILSAVNSAIDQGESPEKFKAALELFEPLRAVTRYPQLVKTVFDALWRVAAQLTGTKDPYVFSLLSQYELLDVLRNPVAFKEEDVIARRDWCAFWYEAETGNISFTTDKTFLDRIGISLDTAEGLTEIKGSVANPGVVQGKVRVINTIQDAQDFQEGDIVVSINTSPSLMPVLVKCGGIVTDEGGIMCHAAIVSRELNNPCIIGTKIATKALKDGQTIEVDANKGIVKIL